MKDISKIMKDKLDIDTESISFYASGIINNNYVVNGKYLFRRKKEFSQFNYDSETEADIETNLKGKDITIPYLYIDSNTKITEFIPNAKDLSHFNKIDDAALISIANKLKELHSYHIKAKSDFLPFNRVEEYLLNSKSYKLPAHDMIVNNLKRFYKNQALYLCHNDLVPGNILFSKDKFYLIDFEYAANNHPFFDIASFITANDIEDAPSQYLFINTYYQSCQPENVDEMKEAFFSFLDLMWYYWAISMYHELHDQLYLDMAKKRLRRLCKYIKMNIDPESFMLNN